MKQIKKFIVNKARIKVLYSFPHHFGAGRICRTAWYQVDGLANAGAQIVLFASSIARQSKPEVEVHKTLSLASLRIPRRITGVFLACCIHDRLTASWLAKNSSSIDVVHVWPLAGLKTSRVANKLGIPVVMERPNAHTEFAYEITEKEVKSLGFELPAGHHHLRNENFLAREILEYESADFLLCPSEFVASTFIERGTKQTKILRHHYGFDSADSIKIDQIKKNSVFTLIYAGAGEPRKGLHHILEAWRIAGLGDKGRLMICGEILPDYKKYLKTALSYEGVKVLGHRKDIANLMKKADGLVMSSVEEGSALVTYEAMGAGCFLLVSNSTGAIFTHGCEGLLHNAGDVNKLAKQIQELAKDPEQVMRMRKNALAASVYLTWNHAGRKLLSCYRDAICQKTKK